MEGHPSQDSNAEAFDRYLAGEATDTGIDAGTDAGTDTVDPRWVAAREILRQDVPDVGQWNVAGMFERVLGDIRGSVPTPRVATTGTRLREASRERSVGSRVLRRLMWPAGLAVSALLAYVLVRPTKIITIETSITYSTNRGQEASVSLPDGSRVTLAPSTTLRLVRFGSRSRTVELEGEAYIEVAHSAGAPFLVRSHGVTARVLGTEFLMRHYPGEAHVHIAVADGRVHVQPGASSASATLVASGVADATDSTVSTQSINTVTASADWVNGKLSFHDRPLPEVLATLGRWYGYEFRVADSTLARERVTLVLSTHSSSAVLAFLEQLLSVNLTVVGDTVTLAPQASRPPVGTPRLHNYDVWTPSREVGR